MSKAVLEFFSLVLITLSAAVNVAEYSAISSVAGFASGAFMLWAIIEGYFETMDTNKRLDKLDDLHARFDELEAKLDQIFKTLVPSSLCPADFSTPPPDPHTATTQALYIERQIAARDAELSMLRHRRPTADP